MPVTDSSSHRHLFLAFMTYTGDRGRFYDWYDEVHIPEMLQAPGVRSVQRFERVADDPPVGAVAVDWGHLALYEFDSELTPFRDFVAERIGSGALRTPDYVDQPPRTLLLRADGVADLANGHGRADAARESRLLLAMTGDVTPGAGARWYDREQLAAILSVPGMLSAQRLVDADVAPLGPPSPDRHVVALHESDGDIGPLCDRLGEIAGGPDAPSFLTAPFQSLAMRAVSARVVPA